MKHPEDLFAEYADGTLPGAERAEVDAHLDACARCRGEVEAAKAAREALRGLPALLPPADLLAQVHEEAAALAPAHPAGATPLKRPRSARWLPGIGVAAVIALLAVVVLPRLGADSGDRNLAAAEDGIGAAEALEIQDADYDTAAVESLALAYRVKEAVGAPVAPAGADGSPVTEGHGDASTRLDAEQLAPAIACLEAAVPGLGGAPVRVIDARFAGEPAYFGVFLTGPGAGQPPDTAKVWVVAKDGCTILAATQATL